MSRSSSSKSWAGGDKVSNLWFGRRRRTHERYLNNLVRVSRSLVLSKLLQPGREYERFQKTPFVCGGIFTGSARRLDEVAVAE
jgi:hypothetical protein